MINIDLVRGDPGRTKCLFCHPDRSVRTDDQSSFFKHTRCNVHNRALERPLRTYHAMGQISWDPAQKKFSWAVASDRLGRPVFDPRQPGELKDPELLPQELQSKRLRRTEAESEAEATNLRLDSPPPAAQPGLRCSSKEEFVRMMWGVFGPEK